jgi:hypothetical protein
MDSRDALYGSAAAGGAGAVGAFHYAPTFQGRRTANAFNALHQAPPGTNRQPLVHPAIRESKRLAFAQKARVPGMIGAGLVGAAGTAGLGHHMWKRRRENAVGGVAKNDLVTLVRVYKSDW